MSFRIGVLCLVLGVWYLVFGVVCCCCLRLFVDRCSLFGVCYLVFVVLVVGVRCLLFICRLCFVVRCLLLVVR